MVEFTQGYLADHWCTKGHLLLCVAGNSKLNSRMVEGFTLTPGMSCLLADNAEAHRTSTEGGAKLFIVD